MFSNTVVPKVQKQLPEIFSKKKSYSKKFVGNIHRKTPVLESIFNKVACNFVLKRLQHKCFPVNISKFVKTPILQNIYEWPIL